MAEGASIASFAAEIGVARSSITEWADKHEEFSVAVKIGKAKCAAWWERVGRKNAVEGGGNATLVIFGLKNMAGEEWREKQEIDVNHTGSLTDGQLESQLAQLLGKATASGTSEGEGQEGEAE